MFDMTVQIQTEDKTINEKIPLNRAVETITDFCRSHHIGTAHLMGNASYLDEVKNNISEFLRAIANSSLLVFAGKNTSPKISSSTK